MFSWFKTFFCCRSKEKNSGTYILELSDNKYYVGESEDIKRRIWLHENGRGSSWTKKYEVKSSIQPEYKKEHDFSELIHTLEMMNKYGINNVRGSLFSSPFPLSKYEKVMAAQLYCDLYGLCRKCGGKGHFITNCKRTTLEDWVKQFGGELNFESITNTRECLKCNIDISSLPKNYRLCTSCFYKK